MGGAGARRSLDPCWAFTHRRACYQGPVLRKTDLRQYWCHSPAAQNFSHHLRKITQQHGALLIFDEVITGFRVSIGGAQKLFKIEPDLTCLGKILGGGCPWPHSVAAREIMDQLAPLGPVYQAGTLSGNPMAVAAGLETLRQLRKPGAYELLETKAKKLADGLASVIARRLDAAQPLIASAR